MDRIREGFMSKDDFIRDMIKMDDRVRIALGVVDDKMEDENKGIKVIKRVLSGESIREREEKIQEILYMAKEMGAKILSEGDSIQIHINLEE